MELAMELAVKLAVKLRHQAAPSSRAVKLAYGAGYQAGL
jgi:hypothetical protein